MITVALPYTYYEKDGRRVYYDDNGQSDKEVKQKRSVLPLSKLVERIKTHEHTKDVCSLLRGTASADEKKHTKMTQLFRIYFGEFELLPNDNGNLKYEDAGMRKHGGVACFDVDNLDPISLSYVIEQLHQDPYVLIGFLSPRGTGYKWLVKIPPVIDDHRDHYRALIEYYTDLLDVKLDESCINPSRCCFMSYDPDVYVNGKSLVWTAKKAEEFPVYMPIVDDHEGDVEAAVKRVIAAGMDLAPDYKTWLKLGASLGTLGERGRSLFHELASVNSNYSRSDTDTLFTKILRTGTKSTIGTFFYMTKGIK